MTRYLLDTNTISDFIRHPRGPVADRIRKLGTAAVCTSIIVAAELRFGVEKRGSRKLAVRVAEALDIMEVLPFESPADAVYGVMRAKLEKAGRPIAANDLLIAAHAVSLGCTLVTDNERDFARISGLSAENWLP
ncbi:MAG TPA: type II toxin-antitoxin system VapC family toxin [Hyphomicrobiaceae bacterium]